MGLLPIRTEKRATINEADERCLLNLTCLQGMTVPVERANSHMKDQVWFEGY